MFYDYYQSPIGVIVIEASDQYLKRTSIQKEATCIKPNHITDMTKKQLDDYFNGISNQFDLPIEFDQSFRSQILKQLYQIDRQHTLSYKQLGQTIHSNAYQAIGSTMKNNPLFIIIPCHLVMNSNGDIGQFYYGSQVKSYLLAHEASFYK